MSQVVLNLGELNDIIDKATAVQGNLVRVRVIAQFHGLCSTNDHATVDPEYIGLLFNTVPYFHHLDTNGKNFGKMIIDESLYHSQFLNNKHAPQYGDVVDLRCCIMDSRVEIMDMKLLKLREVTQLKQFLDSSVGQRFLEISKGSWI